MCKICNENGRNSIRLTQVRFVVGYFNNSLPVLRRVIGAVAVLRLDGDMFESCVDILSNMYDKLSVGGYVIIDDWHDFPCQPAVKVRH